MPKPTISICLIGHVDAGKSTLNGRILLDLGLVDSRTLEKYKIEAAETGRESWYLSWLTDTSPAERAKGKTQEMCSTKISLPKNNIILNDTPGHKLYVQDMIKGANQSDVALLLVSARKGEFEAGFLRSGQTREHVILSKAGGIKTLIVVINKMDEASYDKQIFVNIVRKIHNFLMKFYESIIYVPIAGYHGINVLHDNEKEEFCKSASFDFNNNKTDEDFNEDKHSELISSFQEISLNAENITSENLEAKLKEIEKSDTKNNKEMSWYKGISLLSVLNSVKVPRKFDFAKCTVIEANKNLNTIRIERGKIDKQWEFVSLPKKIFGKVLILVDDEENDSENGLAGDTMKIKTNIELSEGDILFDSEYFKKLENNSENEEIRDENNNVIEVQKKRVGRVFTCSLSILNTKMPISPGYNCLLHLRMATKIAKIVGLQKKIVDKAKNNETKIVKCRKAMIGDRVLAKIEIDEPIYIQVGDSFAIRDEDLTIGVGLIRKVIE